MINRALIFVNMEATVESTESYIFESFQREKWRNELYSLSGISIIKTKNVGHINPDRKILGSIKFCEKFKKILKRSDIKAVDVVATIDNDAINQSITVSQISESYKKVKKAFISLCDKKGSSKVRFHLMLPPKEQNIEYLLNSLISENHNGCLSKKDNLQELSFTLHIKGKNSTKSKLLSWRDNMLDNLLEASSFDSPAKMINNANINIANDFVYEDFINEAKNTYGNEICGYLIILEEN